jgi:peptide/nickel transport system substrate-binding protein
MRTQKIAILLLAVLLLVPSVSFSAAKNNLKIATWGDINTMDPGWMTSTERELTIMNCIYNGLVKYKGGTWKIEPDLAKSWNISRDGKEITFHLRKGVQFQKGYGEMTAEDVKFSFERITDPKANSPEKSTWSSLDHVEVINKYTVKLVMKNRSAGLFTSTLPLNAGMIVSKKAVEKMGREKFAFDPIGTGPYEFVSWAPKQKLELKAFDGYWGKKPKIKNLTFIPIVEASTRNMALRAGEIDIASVSLLDVKKFQENREFNVFLRPGLKYWWVGFTVNKPPFNNLKLRQAVRYAIDVNEIIQAAFQGIPKRANQMFPPGMLGYWKDAPVYNVNLDKAKKLMKEAGYPNGLKATFLIWEGETTRTIAVVVKADLKKIGIDVDIQAKEVGAFNDATKKGQDDFYVSFFATTVDPGYATQWFTCGQAWNLSQWCNPEYDELVKQAESEMDSRKRADLYVKAQKIIDKDCWAIWLTNGVRAIVANKRVNTGKIFPNGRLAPWAMSID